MLYCFGHGTDVRVYSAVDRASINISVLRLRCRSGCRILRHLHLCIASDVLLLLSHCPTTDTVVSYLTDVMKSLVVDVADSLSLLEQEQPRC